MEIHNGGTMSDLDKIDDALNNLVARVELIDETCGLKHSVEDPAENHPAVDYLCQNFKHKEDPDLEKLDQLRIPICQECVDALNDPNWILAYCINCHKSQWIYRPYAKHKHPEGNGIYLCDVCPFCAEVSGENKENQEK